MSKPSAHCNRSEIGEHQVLIGWPSSPAFAAGVRWRALNASKSSPPEFCAETNYSFLNPTGCAVLCSPYCTGARSSAVCPYSLKETGNDEQVLLMAAVFAPYRAAAQEKAGSTKNITGCLQRRRAADKYKLLANDGRVWAIEAKNKNIKMGTHLDQIVRIVAAVEPNRYPEWTRN